MGDGVVRNFKVNKLSTRFEYVLHTCMAYGCIYYNYKLCIYSTLCNAYSLYSKYKTRIVNSACTVVLAMSRQDTAQLPERTCYSGSVQRAVYWYHDYTVCAWRNFGFVANSWLVRTGHWSANRCLTCRSVLYTKAGVVRKGWSYLLRCSMLAKVLTMRHCGGNVVEKGRLFKGLPSADDDAGYYIHVCSCWSVVDVVCNQ